jgi:hypothetical protein
VNKKYPESVIYLTLSGFFLSMFQMMSVAPLSGQGAVPFENLTLKKT